MSFTSKWHRLKELARKSIKMICEGHFFTFIAKFYLFVIRYFFRHEKKQSCEKFYTVSELIYRTNAILTPLAVFRSPDECRRTRCLNFVTDALGTSLLGGVGTALILASQYAIKNNMTLRIITRTEEVNAKDYYEFMDLMREALPNKVLFWSDSEREGMRGRVLEISNSDEFFTTSWWSTAAVSAANTGCRIFYIVQEVEPFFYPHGDLQLWCSWEMAKTDICYIVNSFWLWDYLKDRYPAICARGTWFDPAFPQFLYRPLTPSGKHKLFFYARPNHSRNLFLTGLMVIEEAFMRGILSPEQWDVYLAGDVCEKVEFAGGIRPQYLGRMKWKEYSQFLGSVDVVFSLMYTPHPSYPPLDSLASGCVCVTNSFENKTSCPFCKNIFFCDLTIDSLCDGLRNGIKLALDRQTRYKNFEELSLPSDWSDTLKKTIDFMENFS